MTADNALLRPVDIELHNTSHLLVLRYADALEYRLPFEFLRVYSPSAEVRGHGLGQEVLQTGKKEVRITGIEPVGHYAIRLTFSDGHNSGLYSWDYLAELGAHMDALWQDYLERLAQAGSRREP